VTTPVIFYIRIGDEVFLRFLPEDMDDENDIVQDTLNCLKSIECTEETERDLPDTMREQVYDAWELAPENIYRQWQEQTDPMNVQPDIRKLFSEVGQHLREHWPDEMTQNRPQETVEAVEALRGRRYECKLREVYGDGSFGPIKKSRQLVEKVDEFGPQPFEAPDALPPIDQSEVKFICWMVVAAEERNNEEDRPQLMSQVSVNSFE